MFISTDFTILFPLGTPWTAEIVLKEEHGLWDPMPELTSPARIFKRLWSPGIDSKE
jgi:hypothetical protein